MELSQSVLDLKPNPNVAEFGPGDTVRVHAKVVEGERERIQVFEGTVIRRQHGDLPPRPGDRAWRGLLLFS